MPDARGMSPARGLLRLWILPASHVGVLDGLDLYPGLRLREFSVQRRLVPIGPGLRPRVYIGRGLFDRPRVWRGPSLRGHAVHERRGVPAELRVRRNRVPEEDLLVGHRLYGCVCQLFTGPVEHLLVWTRDLHAAAGMKRAAPPQGGERKLTRPASPTHHRHVAGRIVLAAKDGSTSADR